MQRIGIGGGGNTFSGIHALYQQSVSFCSLCEIVQNTAQGHPLPDAASCLSNSISWHSTGLDSLRAGALGVGHKLLQQGGVSSKLSKNTTVAVAHAYAVFGLPRQSCCQLIVLTAQLVVHCSWQDPRKQVSSWQCHNEPEDRL